MLDRNENLEEVFFECAQCGEKFTLESFFSAVVLYGVIFLIGKDDGYFHNLEPKHPGCKFHFNLESIPF